MTDRPEADAAGWAVLDAATQAARAVLGPRLVGVHAVGSLVHGGFAADVSDVDAVVVLDACDERTPALLAEVAASARASLPPGGVGDRLSLFWGDWATFGAPPATARLPPIVRRDLLDHGVALHGGPPPTGLAVPTYDDLLRESAAFAADRLERGGELELLRDPPALLAAGRRSVTKTVLFPVRFLATACAGLAGSNDEAVRWYVDAARPHAALAEAALRWRTDPLRRPAEAERLLADHLLPLHREALDVYVDLDAVPPDVRERLAAVRARLGG